MQKTRSPITTNGIKTHTRGHTHTTKKSTECQWTMSGEYTLGGGKWNGEFANTLHENVIAYMLVVIDVCI